MCKLAFRVVAAVSVAAQFWLTDWMRERASCVCALISKPTQPHFLLGILKVARVSIWTVAVGTVIVLKAVVIRNLILRTHPQVLKHAIWIGAMLIIANPRFRMD